MSANNSLSALSSTEAQTINDVHSSVNADNADASISSSANAVGSEGFFQWDLGQVQSLADAGGPVIVILSLLSLVAMSVFLFKLWQFFSIGLSKQKNIITALEFWKNKRARDALLTLAKTRNPIARVLEVAITLKNQEYVDDILVKEEVLRIAKRQLANARSHLRILEVIATLSPLLGLLGTVLGMITAFQKLQGAGATIDPSILSGGIWEALLTTAAGLIVAIPTVMALNWLEQKIERFKLNMEDAMTQVFTAYLPHPALSPVQTLKATSPSKKALKQENTNNIDLVSAN